ncbi:hypothetical protein AVEN_58629-1 [Araneus ventricosus]|uniref:Uncharacterized protein n=1 Tax=Araneus ventricosus TaxID=182803 RepID=A0A4Y2SRN4_ARAVE|nr:hypothetical protein AVEN_150725-1 [Araneus ventricosus]GBN90779.1 hypothetical protein AVEN_51697-1 [Araneus ventricosus]GBN91021.1 hypothetical protein AVEN_259798-1 [Araneus ventricosus]GBN91022.1 hypothetical protein AVEN_58629-1 [Araneus ventricosus]
MLPSKRGFNLRKALFFSIASFSVPLIFRSDFSPGGIPTMARRLAHFQRFVSLFPNRVPKFVCEVNGRLKREEARLTKFRLNIKIWKKSLSETSCLPVYPVQHSNTITQEHQRAMNEIRLCVIY